MSASARARLTSHATRKRAWLALVRLSLCRLVTAASAATRPRKDDPAPGSGHGSHLPYSGPAEPLTAGIGSAASRSAQSARATSASPVRCSGSSAVRCQSSHAAALPAGIPGRYRALNPVITRPVCLGRAAEHVRRDIRTGCRHRRRASADPRDVLQGLRLCDGRAATSSTPEMAHISQRRRGRTVSSSLAIGVRHVTNRCPCPRCRRASTACRPGSLHSAAFSNKRFCRLRPQIPYFALRLFPGSAYFLPGPGRVNPADLLCPPCGRGFTTAAAEAKGPLLTAWTTRPQGPVSRGSCPHTAGPALLARLSTIAIPSESPDVPDSLQASLKSSRQVLPSADSTR